MTELKLRDYQRQAIDAVFEAWLTDTKAPAIVLPTGAGKTVVFSHLVKEWQASDGWTAEKYGRRVVILVHRDELADQALNKLRQVLPANVSTGKVKAHDNQVHADVMVCSVQTLASLNRRLGLLKSQDESGAIGLIITDECHHAAAASYRKVYDAFPDALRLGVTATMARGDGAGLGKVWDDVVYQKSILNMIANGYLVDVKAKAIKVTDLAMDQVKVSRGDYQTGELGDALMESGALAAIPKAYKEHASGRRGIVFTPTVETAQAAADELNRAGVRTAVISGETTREDRRRAYDDFRTGRVQVLSNCMVLTEGFDAPWAEVAVIARPTRSAPLYTQMVGRVLRPYPGKAGALVLDLVGASANGLRTLVDLTPGEVVQVKPEETLAEAVIREEREKNKRVPAGSIAFELRVREVNLFAGSRGAWHRTRKGVMYLDVGKGKRIILWPAEDKSSGLWDVVCQATGQRWVRHPEYRNLDISMAMAWGEAVAEDHAEFSPRKDASWRKKPATERQKDYAIRRGIDPTGLNAGALSELISVAEASEVIDRYV